MEIPMEMFYPTFVLSSDRGILPSVYLPLNYEALVTKFYKQKRREFIEDYTKEIARLSKRIFKISDLEIKLNWNEEKGLTNIGLGTHPGFDLNEDGLPKFQEHNLGMHFSIIAGIIAQKYVLELLNSEG